MKTAVQDSLKRLHLYEILLERDVNVLAATFVQIEKTSVSGCATLRKRQRIQKQFCAARAAAIGGDNGAITTSVAICDIVLDQRRVSQENKHKFRVKG